MIHIDYIESKGLTETINDGFTDIFCKFHMLLQSVSITSGREMRILLSDDTD
jgi:hypothetical protein